MSKIQQRSPNRRASMKRPGDWDYQGQGKKGRKIKQSSENGKNSLLVFAMVLLFMIALGLLAVALM